MKGMGEISRPGGGGLGGLFGAVRAHGRYAHFFLELLKRDFKQKYYRSLLGVLWTILNPLLTMAVITFVFSTLFRRDIEYFPVYYLCGWVAFHFHIEATTTGLHAIIDNGGLLKKIHAPAYLFCLSRTGLALINKLFAMIPLLLLMAFLGAPFHWTMALLPLYWIPLFFFSFGLGLGLASLAVHLRDLFHIYSVLSQLWLYLTPVFYPIEILPVRFHVLYALNPMHHYVQMMRDLVLGGGLPAWETTVSGVCFAVAAMGLGVMLYRRLEGSFVLYL